MVGCLRTKPRLSIFLVVVDAYPDGAWWLGVSFDPGKFTLADDLIGFFKKPRSCGIYPSFEPRHAFFAEVFAPDAALQSCEVGLLFVG